MKNIRWIFKENAVQYDWCIFRKTIEIDSIDDLSIIISALDRYVLYINEQFVSRGPVRSHNFEKYYDRIEIGQFAKKGKNSFVILSQYISAGGVYAEILSGKDTLCITDKSWKVKKYYALDSMTEAVCPPLEPVCLNEELFDARVDEDVLLDDVDFGDWDSPVIVHEEYSKIIPHKGGLTARSVLYPEKYMGAAAAAQKYGFSFRLKNTDRKLNKVRKCAGEIYMFNLHSDCEREVNFEYFNLVRCSVNGKEAKRKAVLKSGDNFFAGYFYSSEADTDFIFDIYDGIEISEIKYGDFSAKACVLNLYPDDVFFGWAYPDSNCYKDSDGNEIIDRVLSASGFDEVADLIPKFTIAHVCDISNYLQIKKTIFGEIPGGSLHPSLKLNTEFVSGESLVSNPLNMLNENAEFTTISGDTALFFDFGKENLGYIMMNLCATEGTIIDLMAFEVIDFNGMQYMPKNCMRYICRGGWQKFTSFNPRGFRYLCLVVRNVSDAVKFGSIALESAVTVTESVGAFLSDNQMLNSIYNMCINTARVCMSDSYIDCPGYEQVYWVNDFKVTAMTNLANFGAYGFDYRCLEIAGQSLKEDYVRFYRNDKQYIENKYLTIGAFGSYVYGGFPLAAFHWGLQIYDYYLYSGDTDGTKKLYPLLKKMLSNCDNMMSERGLFAMECAWNLIEWGQNDLLPCCEVTVNSALLSKLYERAALLAKEFGDEAFADICLKKSAGLIEAINRYCWNDKVGGYVDTVRDEFGYKLYAKFFSENGLPVETFEKFKSYTRISEQTNVIMYCCGCVSDERKDAVKKIILDVLSDDYMTFHSQPRENIFNKNRKIEEIVRMGTPFLLYYFFDALADFGEYEGIIKVMERSYSFMIDCGTNTCWETFYNPGADKWTRSISHGWGSSPAFYLQTEICGIKPLKPGFKEFSFNPHLAGLKRVKTEVPTPYGKIFVEIDTERNINKIDYPKECKLIK